MTVMVNLLGVVLIAFIVWWFWLSKRNKALIAVSNCVEIQVEHGSYSPSRILFPEGDAIQLKFIRSDPSLCAEKVIFPELGISQELALYTEVILEIPPLQAGEYLFTCQMGMYQGTLVCQAKRDKKNKNDGQ